MTPARSGVLPRLLLALLAGLLPRLVFAPPGRAVYQDNSASAVITDVDASDFPNMAVRVAVHSTSGEQVRDLPANAFELAENGMPVPAISVSPADIGAQLAFLIVPDDSFAKRDATGTSRMDFVRASINDFLQNRQYMRDNLDEVSLLTTSGPLMLHSGVAEDLRASLAAFNTGLLPGAGDLGGPLLQAVTNAISVAQPVGPNQGRAAAVVLYASALSNVTPEQIDLAASQARTLGVPIYAVNTSAPLEPEAVSATNLRRLAEGSGGEMVYFTDADSITPIYQAITADRKQYLLSYRSHLSVSGQPVVTVKVSMPNGAEAVTTDPVNFPLTVLAPEVAVSGLPTEVRRDPTQFRTDAATSPAAGNLLRIAWTFPDGHQRNMARLRVLIDGESDWEVSEPPFNEVRWDATGANAEAGVHAVQVEMTDELGLVALSAPVQVEFVEVQPETSATPSTAGGGLQVPWLWIGGAVVALAVLVGGGLLALRLRPDLFASLAALADREEPTRPTAARAQAAAMEPTTPIRGAGRHLRFPGQRQAQAEPLEAEEDLGDVPVEAAPKRRAYLEVIQVSQGSRAPIELSIRPITLGRDPSLAAVNFADKSVSRLHARVEADEKGVFHIYDEGSTSGTWVNYEQVTAAGRALQHGDLINLGRVQMRFRLRPTQGTAERPLVSPAGPLAQPGRARDDSTIPFRPKRRPWDRLH